MPTTDARLPRLGHPVARSGFGPHGSRWRHWVVREKYRRHAQLAALSNLVRPPRPEPGFGVLTYHRVAPVSRFDGTPLNVRPQVFYRQLAGLLRKGFEAWPLRRALAAHEAAQSIPNNAFVVVFDDGYENVYRFAWPILKELSVPATVFVATGYVGSDEPCSFDDWGMARRELGPRYWRPLTSEQCCTMYDSGLVDIGTHTHGHFDYRGHPEMLRRDLEQSLGWLHAELGLQDATFSYPYGYHDAAMREVVRELPLLCGLTAECGLVAPESDRYSWRRMGAENWDTANTLAAKLNGWYSHWQAVWRRLRHSPIALGAFA